MFVTDLRIAHVTVKARVRGVGRVENLLHGADRRLGIVAELSEAFLQELLHRAEAVVAKDAGDRPGGAQEVLDLAHGAVDVAEHGFDRVNRGDRAGIDRWHVRVAGRGIEEDATEHDPHGGRTEQLELPHGVPPHRVPGGTPVTV